MAYDENKANRVKRFIECLKHTKGEFHGKPFKLLPWQDKIISDVFGTVRDDDPSMRQYTTAYIEIPKKQGKSELGAAIALNMLVNDDEWKAEVYSCASDRQQAAIVFDVACDMVRQSAALSKRIKIVPSTKRMVYMPTGSIYQVLSSEVATKHGLNVSACIFDELHTQPTRALYDVMTQGSGDARRQPLWFFLTTAGTDRTSICWEVHQKALDILEGRKKDDRFYPVIYGLSEQEDWHKEENWYKANPSLGYTITIDKVRDAYHKALETPADENMFRQLRLNQWTAQSVRWMPMDKWDECGGMLDEYDLEGRACYGGLDLSSTSDLTTLVLVFPPNDESEPYIILPFFWLPKETLFGGEDRAGATLPAEGFPGGVMLCHTSPNDRAGIPDARTCARRALTVRSTGKNGRLTRCGATQLREATTPGGEKPASCYSSETRCVSSA